MAELETLGGVCYGFGDMLGLSWLGYVIPVGIWERGCFTRSRRLTLDPSADFSKGGTSTWPNQRLSISSYE